MSAEISQEFLFFLKSILTGILIIAAYDILRIIRRIINHGTFFIAIEDICYWCISGFLIFCMMYEENDGAIRGFAIVGIILGMIIYNGSVSRFFVHYISFAINWVIGIIRRFLYFITAPLRWLLKKFGGNMTKAAGGMKKGRKFFQQKLKKQFKEVKIILHKK